MLDSKCLGGGVCKYHFKRGRTLFINIRKIAQGRDMNEKQNLKNNLYFFTTYNVAQQSKLAIKPSIIRNSIVQLKIFIIKFCLVNKFLYLGNILRNYSLNEFLCNALPQISLVFLVLPFNFSPVKVRKKKYSLKIFFMHFDINFETPTLGSVNS